MLLSTFQLEEHVLFFFALVPPPCARITPPSALVFSLRDYRVLLDFCQPLSLAKVEAQILRSCRPVPSPLLYFFSPVLITMKRCPVVYFFHLFPFPIPSPSSALKGLFPPKNFEAPPLEILLIIGFLWRPPLFNVFFPSLR